MSEINQVTGKPYYKTKKHEDLINIFMDTLQCCKKDEDLRTETRKMQMASILYLDHYQALYHDEKSDGNNIHVLEDTTFHCVSAGNCIGKTAVLNFANAINPGGGVTRGTTAQEEALCRSSNLYYSINMPYFRKHYYEANKEIGQTVGSDAVIYSPGVVVYKDDSYYAEMMPKQEWFQVNVLTCAAPRIYSDEKNALTAEELKKIHMERGRNILEVAIANKVDTIVLGAFGCGAFHNPPEIVAEAYRKILVDEGYAKCFKKVIFAIKKDRNDVKGNYATFRRILGE